MSAPRPGEIVIEINHPKNSPVMFDPAGQPVRSRFLTPRSGAAPKPCLQAFAIRPIPGQRIHLHIKNRLGRITDPLGDPENKPIIEAVNRAMRELGEPQSCPHDDIEFKALTEEKLLSWMYYMHLLLEGIRVNTPSLVDAGETAFDVHPVAELIQGTFPEEYDSSLKLRQTGKILSFSPRRIAGQTMYIDKVVDEELLAAAGGV